MQKKATDSHEPALWAAGSDPNHWSQVRVCFSSFMCMRVPYSGPGKKGTWIRNTCLFTGDVWQNTPQNPEEVLRSANSPAPQGVTGHLPDLAHKPREKAQTGIKPAGSLQTRGDGDGK